MCIRDSNTPVYFVFFVSKIFGRKFGICKRLDVYKRQADMVALGRQSLADPKLPAKYLADKEDEINWCVACDKCVELLIRQENVGCTVYNRPYTELIRKIREEKGKLRFKVTGLD